MLFAAAFMLCGPIVYFVFVHKKVEIPGVNYVTLIIQQTLNVAPTDWEDKI